jgi:hypothetical protein
MVGKRIGVRATISDADRRRLPPNRSRDGCTKPLSRARACVPTEPVCWRRGRHAQNQRSKRGATSVQRLLSPASAALPFAISTGAQRSGSSILETLCRWAAPKRMKATSVQQPLSPGSAALPFAISTGAQRSGSSILETLCRWAAPKRMKRLLFNNHSPREAPPSPLSSRPERSAVGR